jgi:hypothetical protein
LPSVKVADGREKATVYTTATRKLPYAKIGAIASARAHRRAAAGKERLAAGIMEKKR